MVIPMSMCTFKVGEVVTYRPTQIGRDKSLHTDFAELKPGSLYKIARIEKEAYVVLEGYEGPEGGLYWTEFELAP